MDNALFVLPAGRLPITNGADIRKFRYLATNPDYEVSEMSFTIRLNDEFGLQKFGRIIPVKILVAFIDKINSKKGEDWYKGNLAILDDEGKTLEIRAFMYCPQKREGYIDERGGKFGYVAQRWETQITLWEI